jgi:hypothetical protein
MTLLELKHKVLDATKGQACVVMDRSGQLRIVLLVPPDTKVDFTLRLPITVTLVDDEREALFQEMEVVPPKLNDNGGEECTEADESGPWAS